MKRGDITQFLKDKTEIYKKISDIIGYSNIEEDEGLIDYTESLKWYISGETLFLDHENTGNIDECHQYIISSYAAKGEKFFWGESDGLTYVMAYREDDSWDSSSVYILNNDLIIYD